MPPTTSSAKLVTAACRLNAPVNTAATAKRNKTRPVASLSRLSPSSKVLSRRGNVTRCSTARADTASGGDTIAPRATHAAHGKLGTSSLAANATTAVVNSTAPIASSKMPPRWRRNDACAVNHAPSISSGGRKITSTSSGSSSTTGKPGMNASAPPPASRATAGGSFRRSAR
jgi:hypothetical protein